MEKTAAHRSSLTDSEAVREETIAVTPVLEQQFAGLDLQGGRQQKKRRYVPPHLRQKKVAATNMAAMDSLQNCENPYGRHQRNRENPHGRHQWNRENPHGRHQWNRENPHGRHQSNRENPDERHQVSEYTKVYFDLETTGSKLQEVCHIGAYFSEIDFSRYVCPIEDFEIVVSGLTGLSKKDGSLYLRGERVETVSKMAAWKDFLEFLQSANNTVVLVMHDRHNDCYLLFRDLSDLSLTEEFRKICAGVIDTVPLFRYIFPGRKAMGKNYTLKGLVQDMLDKDCSSGCHNAVVDAVNLEKLIKLGNVQPNVFQRNFFSLSKLEYSYTTHTEARLLMESFPPMSKKMALSILRAGITFDDYVSCYMEGGKAGIASLLSDRGLKASKPKNKRKKTKKTTAITPNVSKQGVI